MSKDLPITEELDFHYLLELMPPLHNVEGFAWLPELFSILGYERLILLCKYAGGETITLPTVPQLSDSIEALQWFYDVNINRTKQASQVPDNLKGLYEKIVGVYFARNS